MTPDTVTQIVTPFFERGLLGVVVLVLGFAVVKLYNRNQELHEALYQTGRETVKANEAMAASLNAMTTAIRDLTIRAG
jgi:hypothetical protein